MYQQNTAKKSLKNHFRNLNKLAIPMLLSGACLSYAAVPTTLSLTSDFKTQLAYPELNKVTAFNLLSDKEHEYLFYNGKNDQGYVSGYYRSAWFGDWDHYGFNVFKKHDDDSEKHSHYKSSQVLTVSLGSYGGLVALSKPDEDLGQYLSYSPDGQTWTTYQLTEDNTNFDRLASIKDFGVRTAFAYSTTHNSYLLLQNSGGWSKYPFPNGSDFTNENNVRVTNNFFGSLNKEYALIRTVVSKIKDDTNSDHSHDHGDSDELKNNVNYCPPSLLNDESPATTSTTSVYHAEPYKNWVKCEDVPFAKESVEKAFDNNHKILAVATKDNNSNHKLWLTTDFHKWYSYSLPQDKQLADMHVFNKHRIDLLLTHHDEERGGYNTELVSLDPANNETTLVKSFDGKIRHLSVVDGQYYLSGDFVNPLDMKHTILVATSFE